MSFRLEKKNKLTTRKQTKREKQISYIKIFSNLKNVKKKRLSFWFRFVINSDGRESLQCCLCGKVIANASSKPCRKTEEVPLMYSS